MVRVFKCHSFASQHVIPVSKEPLTICAENDKVFVATNDCEIIVYRVFDGTSSEIHRCPTISQVEKIVYNSYKNYIATIELKKSWKRVTKSVRVYLNWDTSTPGGGKPRTKVRIAGKSHVQHISGVSNNGLEIVEVPLEGNATCVAVCKYTGNFAVACGSEVKLCSVVEKTVANSDKTYLDVEVFLELCWNFAVEAISLCEEFVICSSHREVQGIRVRYDEGEKKPSKKFPGSPSTSVGSGGRSASASYQEHREGSRVSSGAATPQSYISETIMFNDHGRGGRSVTFSPHSDPEDLEFKSRLHRRDSEVQVANKDFSMVGMKPSRQSPKPTVSNSLMSTTDTQIVDDDNFTQWSFHHGGAVAGGASVCLPGLHSSSTESQCHHHAHLVSPPVLSDFSGGKVKSCSGVQAETILHLSDPQEKEDWMSVQLIPTHSAALTAPVRMVSVSTDRMRSVSSTLRTSMCCYISGTRGGYLYQISPVVTQISSYKYTDTASQVGVSQSHLHIVTPTGIETYTSRWGLVSLEMQEKEEEELTVDQAHAPSSLDICLCGHEPFLGAINLAMGAEFLVLLSKVEDSGGSDDAHWGVYVLHSFSLVDIYKDMISFAEKIEVTSPASYIHLLQEAHVLLVTHPLYTVVRDLEVKECVRQVCRLLGEYYAQPRQDDWSLCWPYYHNAGASVQDMVTKALEHASKYTPKEFGKGVLDSLDHILFSHDEYINLTSDTCDTILKIYAVAAPEKLSRVILLSNMKDFSAETAYHHLKTWLSVKASASQPVSAVDKLAIVQLQLTRCEVEPACRELESINKGSLVDLCSSHPALIHDNLSTFTPLAQLMRQHLPTTLLEILVHMLDRCVISLDSLLILLKSQGQSDLPHNNHIREVLELVVTDGKRAFLFEEAVQMLCETYISKIKDRSHPSLRQMNALAHHKFVLPQGNGHFAPRFAWLDYLPPFQGPSKITKICQRLEVKHIPGQGSRGGALPITLVTRQLSRENCQCVMCNENLLKLQSLLCSPRLTSDLAAFVLGQLENRKDESSEKVKDTEEDECWDSVRLLCQTRLNVEKATEQVVDNYPSVAGMFAASCFHENVDQYAHLLRYMEKMIKACSGSSQPDKEENYVKAYKDLLSRMTELFPPAQFLELLPADGNLYFLLPFLCTSLNMEHTAKLKQKVVDMGKDLMTQI